MSSFRDRTTQAIGWDLAGNYGGQIASFIISIILARLLDPEDFGLVGMSMVFIAILQVFKDMGFASALIQSKENSSLTYSSIFYLNIFTGAVFTFLIYFAAPFIGKFYENSQITNLVRLLSIIFFISSFNVVQSTILRKNLDFKSLTVRDLFSQIFAGVVAVFFAFNGFGIYSLIIQQIIAAILQTILLWKITNWYPKFEFSWEEVKKLSGFSLYVFAAQSVNQILKQADTLIIGKLFSPATLGFFTRANSLNSLVIRNSSASISKVFYPALAGLQEDNERFQKVFLKVIKITSAISVYLTGVFFLVGEELIITLFGSKWEPSVFIFQILIIRAFTYPISSMVVNAFMAKGKSKQNFHYGNIRKVLQLIPMFIAFFYGFKPFLFSIVAVAILSWILNNFFATFSLGVSLKAQFMAVSPNLIFSAVVLYGIKEILPEKLNIPLAIVEVVAFSLLFFIFLICTKSELIKEGNIILQKLKRKL